MATTTTTELDDLCIATIRALCIDAIQAANSGHPGTPIGIAPLTYLLWQRFLRFDPADPIWPNRDRYVLSSGHASALLWSMLHLTRVQAVDPEYEVLGRPAVSLDDLRRFRQLDSRAPGHPEYRWTSGVETTTGPLGAGVATSVGMAVASRWLGTRYNRDGHTLFDFDVYAQAGDGCMMEGVASEAASFAAYQRLSNLCWIYDSNRVTIERLNPKPEESDGHDQHHDGSAHDAPGLGGPPEALRGHPRPASARHLRRRPDARRAARR
jgi:transketolase